MNDTDVARPDSQIAPDCGHYQPVARPGHFDPLVLALARYVEALHQRYPTGPAQMRREALAARGNITPMSDVGRGRVA